LLAEKIKPSFLSLHQTFETNKQFKCLLLIRIRKNNKNNNNENENENEKKEVK